MKHQQVRRQDRGTASKHNTGRPKGGKRAAVRAGARAAGAAEASLRTNAAFAELASAP